MVNNSAIVNIIRITLIRKIGCSKVQIIPSEILILEFARGIKDIAGILQVGFIVRSMHDTQIDKKKSRIHVVFDTSNPIGTSTIIESYYKYN